MQTNLETIEMLKSLIYMYDSTLQEIDERLTDLRKDLKDVLECQTVNEDTLHEHLRRSCTSISLLLHDIQHKNI